jgi:adenylyltransferase/sulfurtransferase
MLYGSYVKIQPLISSSVDISIEEIKRYSRHVLLPEIGLENQKRISNSEILVIGAGGLGSPILMYLAASGVKELGICDFDVVDETNLQRQLLFNDKSVGKDKALEAKTKITELNPNVKVSVFNEMITSKNAENIVKDFDLVIDGSDNFATRYLLNDVCVILDKPYIWASIYRFDGQVSVFWKKHGPCYRCLHPEPPPTNMVQTCASGGVLASMCATIASLQVTQALQLITGVGDVLIGEVLSYSALDANFRKVKVNKDPNCVVCGKNPSITSLIDYEQFCGPVKPRKDPGIKAVELKEMLDKRNRKETDFLLIDVREEPEKNLVEIEGSIFINKDDIFASNGLALIPKDKPAVLYCRSGNRSTEVMNYLKHNGYLEIKHLEGGIISWVKDIETNKPSY